MKLLVVAVLLVACTKPNPAVCCLDEADCAEIQAEGVRPCDPGFACVDHACVLPSCASEGCASDAPVCNLATDVCEGCTDAAECARFPATPLCEATSGSCVECVIPADCPVTAPICDVNACRVCRADSECVSGACGDDGACIAEAEVVYVDAAGTDAGTCPRTAPCRSLQFAAGVAGTQRFHIVMAPGLYTGITQLGPSTTSATQLFVHGHGADLEGPSAGDDIVLSLSVATTVRDLYVSSNTGGTPIAVFQQASTLERVTIREGLGGLNVSSSASLLDFVHEGAGTAIELETGAHLSIDGAVIKGSARGIRSTATVSVSITNLLVYGTSGLALDIPYATGTIASTTIADCGTSVTTGPGAVNCGSGLTIRSSIIWTPGATLVPVSGCNLSSTIAGPVATPGASNADPKFVDPAMDDYHLAGDSPARDMVDTGPPTDFEGEARPQGARFDIGADEASP